MLKNILYSIIIFQIICSPFVFHLKPAHAADPAQEQPSSQVSKAEIDQDLEDLKAVIEGRSRSTRNRLDTFGLFDTEVLPDLETLKSLNIDYRSVVFRSEISDVLQSDFSSGEEFRKYDSPVKVEVSFQGVPLFKTRFGVKAAGFFRHYFVFLEEGTFHERVGTLPEDQPIKGVQYVSFIDLKRFKGLIGKSPLPIFSMPVSSPNVISEFRAQREGLVVRAGGSNYSLVVPEDVFTAYSDAQTMALETSANLLSEETYETIGPLVESFEAHFLKATEEAVLGNVDALAERNALLENMKKKMLSNPKSDYHKALTSNPHFLVSLTNIKKDSILQKKTFNRLGALAQHLTRPASEQAPLKLGQSLMALSYAIKHKDGSFDEAFATLKQDHGKKFLFGKTLLVAGLSTIALASIYPETFSHFMYESLEVSRVVLGAALGKIRGFYDLLAHATVVTLSGFNPSVFYNAYLSKGSVRAHFIIGVTAFVATGLAIIGLPVMIVNSWKLARDFFKMSEQGNLFSFSDLSWFEKESSFFEKIARILKAYFSDKIDAFIKRQQKIQKDFLDDQSKGFADIAKRHGTQVNTKFTYRDELQVDQILESVESSNQNVISKMIARVSTWNIFKKKTQEKVAKVNDPDDAALDRDSVPFKDIADETKINGFTSALSNFCISYASLTGAFEAMVRAWNGFTIFRRVFWSPTLWYTQLVYPNLINTVVGDGTTDLPIFPTKANGGLLGPLETSKRVFQFLTFNSSLDRLQQWEKKVLPLEAEILEQAINLGFLNLQTFLKTRGGDTSQLFIHGVPNTLTDPRILEYSNDARLFFRVFVETAYEKTLQKILKQRIENIVGYVDSDHSDIEDLKKLSLRMAVLQEQENAILSVDAEEIKKELQGFEDLAWRKALHESKDFTKGFLKQIDNIARVVRSPDLVLRHNAANIVDPKLNPTMERIRVVLKMLQNPDAMPRAVRATLSSLITAKTFGFVIALFALAGVDSGVMKPLHDEMFGPNSFFHLGRVPFVSGLLMGLWTSVFSNAWSKLQQDAFHHEHFGEVPKAQEKGFFKWYLKQSFKNPNNKWWDNQKNQYIMVTRNLKPAFVLIALTYLISLGRIDLDGYVISYLVWYLNPLNGLNAKLEQGMEFASYYWLKDIPQKYWGHPRVQKMLARRQQKARFGFAIWEKLFVDMQESIIGNFQRVSFRGQNEALSRMIFFGYTPTELAVIPIRTLENGANEIIPGLGTPLKGCELLLTNNYTNWSKLPPTKK